MESRVLYLVWYDMDESDPLFLGVFNKKEEAETYIASIDHHEIHAMGLHPSNFRISVVPYKV